MVQKEAAFELLASFYDSHSQPFASHRSPSADSLLRMFQDITGLFSLTTILIDGLDEISTNRYETVQLLQGIQDGSRKIMILFASRCERDIEQYLEGFVKSL